MSASFGVILVVYAVMYVLCKDGTRCVFDSTFEARLTLMAECLMFPGLFASGMVAQVGRQRYGNAAQDPVAVAVSNRKMATDARILANTMEQTLLFTIATIGLSFFLPADWLWILPTNAIMFTVGRVLFFVGYHVNPIFRGPGFNFGFSTSNISLIYCCVVVAIKYWIVASSVLGFVVLICVVGCCVGSEAKADEADEADDAYRVVN